jgi:CheY-like chemotaxis protein
MESTLKQDRSILLVEDDVIDRMTVERALKEIRVTNPMVSVENGEEALAFLRDPANVTPGIILLDLNMPKMNGIEFLKVVKQDEELKRIPVIVLTTSKDEQDRVSSFDLGVAGYMIKPVDYMQFVEVVRAINMYWTLSELSD